MKLYKVEQLVKCEVRVTYNVRADSMEEALQLVAEEKCPTARDGADHYVTTDNDIVYTLVGEDR